MTLKNPDHVMDINLKLGHQRINREDAFDLRTDAIEVGNASAKIWNDLSDRHKEVLKKVAMRSIEVLHDNIDSWLPNVLTGQSGDMVTIRNQILLSEIEEAVEIIESKSSFGRNAAKENMIAELVGKRTKISDEDFVAHVDESLDNGVHIPAHAVKRLVDIINGVDPEENEK